MTSEPARPAESGAAPDTVAPAEIVTHQRAELDLLDDERRDDVCVVDIRVPVDEV